MVSCITIASAFLIRSRTSSSLPQPLPAAPQQLPVLLNSAQNWVAPSEVCQNIYHFVCQKPGESHDPTGNVRPDIEGERQAIHLYREIIRNHRDWTSEQVAEELVRQIFDTKRRIRIESAYYWVKQAIKRFIERQPTYALRDEEKLFLKTRISKTKLQLPFPASVYADEPDLLTKNEVYYERLNSGETRLRVGGAYVLIAKSWFNLVFTLAHELAHSIDPCEIRAAGHPIPAYDQLSACFLKSGLIALPKERMECGASDQLSETFADWVAVQVTIDALGLYVAQANATSPISRSPAQLNAAETPRTSILDQVLSSARNSVRDLCAQEGDQTDLEQAIHPPPHIRISSIFGPPIQQFLGCPTLPTIQNYCSFQTKESHP
jgi:hypothetical protein